MQSVNLQREALSRNTSTSGASVGSPTSTGDRAAGRELSAVGRSACDLGGVVPWSVVQESESTWVKCFNPQLSSSFPVSRLSNDRPDRTRVIIRRVLPQGVEDHPVSLIPASIPLLNFQSHYDSGGYSSVCGGGGGGGGEGGGGRGRGGVEGGTRTGQGQGAKRLHLTASHPPATVFVSKSKGENDAIAESMLAFGLANPNSSPSSSRRSELNAICTSTCTRNGWFSFAAESIDDCPLDISTDVLFAQPDRSRNFPSAFDRAKNNQVLNLHVEGWESVFRTLMSKIFLK